MPVTSKPSPEIVGRNSDHTVHSAQQLLKATSRLRSVENQSRLVQTNKKAGPENRAIIQSSFHDLNGSSAIIPYGNGLVNGIIRAFQQDLHLILRPDDIWLSILTQFSMFVNANAELLRALFVAHEGKKQLTIDVSPFSVWDVEIGKFAQEMAGIIQENVVDPDLKDWIIPDFSTTTDNDKSVASIVMMGTLQKYFEYTLVGGCGFPSVTLLGEKSDWEEILRKLQKLPKYSHQTGEWSQLLTPIIRHMIATFDEPESQRVKDFWLRACHSAGRDGSGSIETLSGWITAFCFWSEEGKRIPSPSEESLQSRWSGASIAERKRLTLDGITYPMVRPRDIPQGVVSVPVTIQDLQSGLEYENTLVAGSVGMAATANGQGGVQTTVQPRSGWWMLEDSVKPILGAPQHRGENHSAVKSESPSGSFDDCAFGTLR
jgi:hypothetical protein